MRGRSRSRMGLEIAGAVIPQSTGCRLEPYQDPKGV
jgi:hypothetical protein